MRTQEGAIGTAPRQTSASTGTSSSNPSRAAAAPRHQCPYCTASYVTPETLEAHIQNKHPDAEPVNESTPFLCNCGRVFDAELSLDMHRKYCKSKQRRASNAPPADGTTPSVSRASNAPPADGATPSPSQLSSVRLNQDDNDNRSDDDLTVGQFTSQIGRAHV